MRIEKKFGETTKYFSSVQNDKTKYILAYEGNRTEVQYFNGIIDNRETLNVNPLILLVPLLRSMPQNTNSHPKWVLELMTEHLDNYNCAKVLIDKIVDFIFESIETNTDNSSEKAQALRKALADYFINELSINMDDEITDKNKTLINVSKFLEDTYNINNRLDEIEKYIEDQQILYNKDVDKVYIIIDRNINNLKDYNAYNNFLNKCIEKKYNLIVSNPDFELWLLMHTDKIFSYDRKTLHLNKKKNLNGNTSKKRYLENVLSKEFDGYKKEKINFEKFLPNVKNAIINEKKFCEDINKLENKLGSNVGVLLEEIISNN